MAHTILAIDTATGPCSVAVWANGKIAAYNESNAQAMQSAILMPMIEQVLEQSGIGYSALTAVAATVGPGSFTGIRTGLAAARAIAFSANIKALGYTTLEVLAFAAGQQAGKGQALAVLNAGKGEFYYQAYDLSPLRPLSEAMVGAFEPALPYLKKPAFIVGNSGFEAEGMATVAVTFPRADALAGLAAASPENASPLQPFYIRAPDAKLPASLPV